jgi:predicted DCC family thiol-disulfide oxidoreductase YuxK
MSLIPEGKIVIQFDGICVLCSRTVRFLLRADRNNKLLFQTLQNSADVKSIDTVIVFDHFGRRYDYFDAVLKIGHELGGAYKLVAIFKVLPRSWRHSIYMWIARNRFRWFGRRKTCYLPDESEKGKFI